MRVCTNTLVFDMNTRYRKLLARTSAGAVSLCHYIFIRHNGSKRTDRH